MIYASIDVLIYLELMCVVIAADGLYFTPLLYNGLYTTVWGITTCVVKLWAQHDPNINVSMHIPTCWPSDLMHSHTNMQVPAYELPIHGFGLILKLVLLPGIATHIRRSNRSGKSVCVNWVDLVRKDRRGFIVRGVQFVV